MSDDSLNIPVFDFWKLTAEESKDEENVLRYNKRIYELCMEALDQFCTEVDDQERKDHMADKTRRILEKYQIKHNVWRTDKK